MSDAHVDEILSWVRIMGASALRDLLGIHIRSETDWLVYESTDGEKNRDQVGRQAGISGRAVGNKWSAWRDAGILIEHPDIKYPRRIASASSVGFEKPG